MEIYDYVWFLVGRGFLWYMGVMVALATCGFAYDIFKNKGNCFRVFMSVKLGFCLSMLAVRKVFREVKLFFMEHGK
jgi:predicted membrane channel-forming protein YqfA (hemolysin III family)